MTLLSPFQNPLLLGHDDAVRQFEESRASGRLHHAWLIAGNEGIGKATLAAHLIQSLFSEGQNKPGALDMDQPIARLIAAETHPDLIVVKRPTDEKTGALKESISVDAARLIEPFLRLTPTHGRWRAALIDEAHLLNWNGQNALLKVIEEPPKNCVIFITVTTPGAMLPTIRSRCRFLQLEPLAPENLETLMDKIGGDWGDAAQKARLVAFAGGSPGLAIKLRETEALTFLTETEALFESGFDGVKAHALAERFTKKVDSASFFVLMGLLTESLKQAIFALARGTPPSVEIPRFYQGLTLDRLLVLWDKRSEILAETDAANLDRKLAFLRLLQEIRQARH